MGRQPTRPKAQPGHLPAHQPARGGQTLSLPPAPHRSHPPAATTPAPHTPPPPARTRARGQAPTPPSPSCPSGAASPCCPAAELRRLLPVPPARPHPGLTSLLRRRTLPSRPPATTATVRAPPAPPLCTAAAIRASRPRAATTTGDPCPPSPDQRASGPGRLSPALALPRPGLHLFDEMPARAHRRGFGPSAVLLLRVQPCLSTFASWLLPLCLATFMCVPETHRQVRRPGCPVPIDKIDHHPQRGLPRVEIVPEPYCVVKFFPDQYRNVNVYTVVVPALRWSPSCVP